MARCSWRPAVAALALALAPLANAHAAPPVAPDRVVVIGDSLSDVGNDFILSLHQDPPPPYWQGRFSNGPVWAELVAQHFGLSLSPSLAGGLDWSFGGAKTDAGGDSLKKQTDAFLGMGPSVRGDASTLYIIWGGGNDLTSDLRDPNAAALVAAAANNIRDIVVRLIGAGGRQFMVLNLPDKSLTPAARGRNDLPVEHALSLIFDQQLTAALAAIDNPAIALVQVDIWTLVNAVIARPQAFGFTDAANPCIVPSGNSYKVCGNPYDHVFWDDVHPTAHAHQVIAEWALDSFYAAQGRGVASARR